MLKNGGHIVQWKPCVDAEGPAPVQQQGAVQGDPQLCSRVVRKGGCKTQTKEEEVYGMFVQQLRGFVTILTESKGGSRTKEDQNAIDVVLAALIHPSVFGKSLGRTVQRMLGVSWKAIVRAVKARKEFEKVPSLPPSETI